MRRLKTRISRDGLLRVISQQTRGQEANRELAVERFVELMREAVRKVPVRKKTRVSKGRRSEGWMRRDCTAFGKRKGGKRSAWMKENFTDEGKWETAYVVMWRWIAAAGSHQFSQRLAYDRQDRLPQLHFQVSLPQD